MRNIVLLAAAVGAVAVASPAAQAAKPKKVKACALATPGQVQMVSGDPVGAKSKRADGPAGKITELCLYNYPGDEVSPVIIGVTTTKDAAVAFKAGQKSLPSKPLSGIGTKAYQVIDNGTVAFLYKHWYVVVQPSLLEDPRIDLAKVPDLAKVVYSSLKSYG